MYIKDDLSYFEVVFICIVLETKENLSCIALFFLNLTLVKVTTFGRDRG